MYVKIRIQFEHHNTALTLTILTLTSKLRIAQILKNKILIVSGEIRNPSSNKTKARIYQMHKFDPQNIDITLRSELKLYTEHQLHNLTLTTIPWPSKEKEANNRIAEWLEIWTTKSWSREKSETLTPVKPKHVHTKCSNLTLATSP